MVTLHAMWGGMESVVPGYSVSYDSYWRAELLRGGMRGAGAEYHRCRLVCCEGAKVVSVLR